MWRARDLEREVATFPFQIQAPTPPHRSPPISISTITHTIDQPHFINHSNTNSLQHQYHINMPVQVPPSASIDGTTTAAQGTTNIATATATTPSANTTNDTAPSANVNANVATDIPPNATDAEAVDGTNTVKCSYTYCPKLSHEEFLCGVDDCNRKVHAVCYTRMCSKSKKDIDPIAGKYFCTLKHHEKFTKLISEGNFHWSNDGPNGKNDTAHSEYHLVDWLRTGENYDKFRGPPGAKTKEKICAEVADWIHDKGVKVKRTSAQVRSKIESIEAQMKAAITWASQTGQGMQEEDLLNGTKNFEDGVSSCFQILFNHYPSPVCLTITSSTLV